MDSRMVKKYSGYMQGKGHPLHVRMLTSLANETNDDAILTLKLYTLEKRLLRLELLEAHKHDEIGQVKERLKWALKAL